MTVNENGNRNVHRGRRTLNRSGHGSVTEAEELGSHAQTFCHLRKASSRESLFFLYIRKHLPKSMYISGLSYHLEWAVNSCHVP